MLKRFALMGAAIIGLSMAGLAGSNAGTFASTAHCPDHQDNPGKIEVDDSFGPTVTLPAGTEFCVKAGTGASGILVSDGNPYTVTWTNRGGQTPDISYYIVYTSSGDPD
jgi:hypothetical protein